MPQDYVKEAIAKAVQILVNEQLEEQLDVMGDVPGVEEIDVIEVSDTEPLLSQIRVSTLGPGMPRYFSVKVSEQL